MDSKEGGVPGTPPPPSYDDSVEKYPQQQQHGGPGGYPQHYPGFPPQPGCPPQQAGSYPPQQAGGYQPPSTSGYPPQPAGPDYTPQPAGGNPPQSAGGNPPQSAGGNPPQPAGGYPTKQCDPTGATTHKPVDVVVAAAADPINRGGLGAEYEGDLRSTSLLTGIACLCFCCPLGIVAFFCLQSSQTAAAEGLRDLAYQRLGKARELAIFAILIGIVIYIVAGICG